MIDLVGISETKSESWSTKRKFVITMIQFCNLSVRVDQSSQSCEFLIAGESWYDEESTLDSESMIMPQTSLFERESLEDITSDNHLDSEKSCVLTSAIKDVESLTGVALITVLTTVEGVVLTVSDVAQLVFGLLTLIFGGLSAILKVAYNLDANVIIPLLAEVAELVATLLQLILQLVDGLLACLLPFLGSILTIIISLGISDEYSFLNISVSSVVATATGYAS